MELVDRMAFTLEQVRMVLDSQALAWGDAHLRHLRADVHHLLEEHPSPQQVHTEIREHAA